MWRKRDTSFSVRMLLWSFSSFSRLAADIWCSAIYNSQLLEKYPYFSEHGLNFFELLEGMAARKCPQEHFFRDQTNYSLKI